jgi:hypothetical protein
MPGSLNQFVLVKARKSRGGEWWSTDDYDVRVNAGKVVGRIMLHPQAPKDQPWFWTITAREIPPSIHNRGYIQRHANGRWRIDSAKQISALGQKQTSIGSDTRVGVRANEGLRTAVA